NEESEIAVEDIAGKKEEDGGEDTGERPAAHGSQLAPADEQYLGHFISWGPVQCSGAARPAVQPPRGSRRAPQTPSASSTPLGVGLPVARSVSALALGLPSSFAPLLACHQGQERLLERDLDRGEREEAPAAPGDARRQLGARV